MVVIINIISII